MSPTNFAGVILATIALGATIGYLLYRATYGRNRQPDDNLRRAWCPMCERATLLLHETKLVAELRDQHRDGDIGCRIIDGHRYAIRIAGTALLCAACSLPHETRH